MMTPMNEYEKADHTNDYQDLDMRNDNDNQFIDMRKLYEPPRIDRISIKVVTNGGANKAYIEDGAGHYQS